MRRLVTSVLMLASLPAAGEVPWFDGGHTKARVLGVNYPDDSVLQASAGEWASDQGADLRLKFTASGSRLELRADYQLQALFGDSLDFPEQTQGLLLTTPSVPDDDRRWW